MRSAPRLQSQTPSRSKASHHASHGQTDGGRLIFQLASPRLVPSSMYAVIPTDNCRRKLDRHALVDRVARIAADLESAREPMVLRRHFRSIPPYLVHRADRLRLIGSLRTVNG